MNSPNNENPNASAPDAIKSEQPDPTPRVKEYSLLKVLLDHTNPFCSDKKREHVLRATHHETGGSDEGLALFDDWLNKGDNHPGTAELAAVWRTLEYDAEAPASIETLREMVADDGFDLDDVYSLAESDHKPRKSTVSRTDEPSPVTPPAPVNPLDKFSLKGMRSQLEQNAVGQVHVLGQLALMGQLTVFYASPGTGKSLLTLSLLIDAISQGKIDPTKVYYFNFDDNLDGLLEKLDIVDEFKFHMFAEGCNDFSADKFLIILAELIDRNQANGIIIILDTLKKFVDLMNKRKSCGFGKLSRSLVMKGGTCIGLAHTNKHRGSDNKPIHAGTSDIVEDFDCAYLMYEISVDADTETKTILFENIKSRGNVARQVSYRYSITEGLSYRELFDSVDPVEDADLVTLKQAEEVRSDAEAIDIVTQCIRAGINTRMKLAETVAERSGISKRAALRLIDKYSGNDPDRHRWNFQVHERGAKKYCLLKPNATDSDLVVKP